jgi:hypothetical protein
MYQTRITEDGVEVYVIHYSVEVPDSMHLGQTQEVIACLPSRTDLKTVSRTNEPRAVRCPLCQETQAYKTAMARLREPQRFSA